MDSTANEPSDESLIRATLAGDDATFAGSVGRYKRRVFGLAARFKKNVDERKLRRQGDGR